MLIKRAIIAVTALALMVAMAIPAFGQDDVSQAVNTQTGQSGSIAQTALQCVEADEGNLVECLIAAQNNGNGDDDGDQTTVDQANEGNQQNATAIGGTGGNNNGSAVAVGGDGDDNVVAINQQMQCQPATA